MELWIHVDFKCLAPDPDALIGHISSWSEHGATGIVFEWENMFPYSGFEDAVRKDAYTRKEVTRILNHCRALGLKAVPLVQTFGHVKWFLSHPKYAGLREFEDYPNQIRACDEKSHTVISSWINDLLEAHHDSPYVHLGADEAWRLKEIDRRDCSSIREGSSAVFLRHMYPLFKQVIDAGKRPIIWADMVLSHLECLGEFPEELVFCDWMYHQTSEYNESVYAWGRGSINSANYSEVSDEKKRHFERYWRCDADDFPSRFYQFPYLPFLRDKGFDVIAAPTTLYAGHSLAGPAIARVRANERGWLNAAERFGGLGALNTCWAIRGALREATMVGHRAFLIQGGSLPAIPEDSIVAVESWQSAAGGDAERMASIVDSLAPPLDSVSMTRPLFFDVETRTHRPIAYDSRLSGLEEELAKLADEDPKVLAHINARECAIRAEEALAPIAQEHEETIAWRLGAVETLIRTETWLAVREHALGRTVKGLDLLRNRIMAQAEAVADFMKNRYRPAELDIVREDRYEGLLRLTDKIGGGQDQKDTL